MGQDLKKLVERRVGATFFDLDSEIRVVATSLVKELDEVRHADHVDVATRELQKVFRDYLDDDEKRWSCIQELVSQRADHKVPKAAPGTQLVLVSRKFMRVFVLTKGDYSRPDLWELTMNIASKVPTRNVDQGLTEVQMENLSSMLQSLWPLLLLGRAPVLPTPNDPVFDDESTNGGYSTGGIWSEICILRPGRRWMPAWLRRLLPRSEDTCES